MQMISELQTEARSLLEQFSVTSVMRKVSSPSQSAVSTSVICLVTVAVSSCT